jgi:hypothetical protein
LRALRIRKTVARMLALAQPLHRDYPPSRQIINMGGNANGSP